MAEPGKELAKKSFVPGGKPGPGRPRGSPNKHPKDKTARIKEAMAILNGPVTPLSIMWDMARGRRRFNPDILEACKAAAPYVHPKLVAVQIDASVNLSHEQSLAELDRIDARGNPNVVTGGSFQVLEEASGEGFSSEMDEAIDGDE